MLLVIVVDNKKSCPDDDEEIYEDIDSVADVWVRYTTLVFVVVAYPMILLTAI